MQVISAGDWILGAESKLVLVTSLSGDMPKAYKFAEEDGCHEGLQDEHCVTSRYFPHGSMRVSRPFGKEASDHESTRPEYVLHLVKTTHIVLPPH